MLASWTLALAQVGASAPQHALGDEFSAPEPYAIMHGADPTALPARPASPDPLVRCTWNSSVDSSRLQQVAVSTAVTVHAEPASAFEGLESLIGDCDVNVLVKGPGWIRLDYGLERPAWLEGISADLNITGQGQWLKASISEYDEPYDGKETPVTMYGSTFRLETPVRSTLDHSGHLYEGVRYAWLCFAVDCPWSGQRARPPAASPIVNRTTSWRLTGLRLVYKFQPLAYTGSFSSCDPGLERIWYTGAYGVRANMQANSYGSILIDRGDRYPFQGDGYPTMIAAATAFGSPGQYDLTRQALELTDCYTPLGGKKFCRFPNASFMFDLPRGSYPVYWTLSVFNYYWASGDSAQFTKLLPDVEAILGDQIRQFDQCLLTSVEGPAPNCNYEFMGWDDRLGNGKAEEMAAGGEPFRVFNSLVAQAVREFAACLEAAGRQPQATHYAQVADDLAAKIRAAQPIDSFGLHSAAHAINAGIFRADVNATAALFARNFNDFVTICSSSPFNTYFIVQALGNMGRHEHAIATLNKCWEPMTRLGRGCFWESFDPDWADIMQPGQKAPGHPSYCHPWSSGATASLSKFLLGVGPVTPGFKRIAVTPFVSATWPEVRGTVPVRSGTAVAIVNASFVAVPTDNRQYIRITIDSPVPASVGLPLLSSAGCTLHSLRVDGDWQASILWRDFGPLRLSFAFSSELEAGHHIVVGHYMQCPSGSRTPHMMVATDSSTTTATSTTTSSWYPFPAPAYPIQITLDKHTRGGWVGMYGSEAYTLFGYDRVGGTPSAFDRVHIPRASFVNSFSIKCCTRQGCQTPNSTWIANHAWLPNGTLLADPAGLSRPASLGRSGCGGGSTRLDVNTTVGVWYQLAVYMVASAGDLSSVVTQVLDLRTLSPVAKATAVKRYGAGAWLVLECDRPVRLKVGPIDGAASVSASMVSPTVRFEA